MADLFRNSSPGALTREQAVAQIKKRVAERHRQMQQARELAAQGRGGDTEVAHVARGELIVPLQLQSPQLIAALSRAAAYHNIPLEMLSIGNAMNSINPNTGTPEFGVMDMAPDEYHVSDNRPLPPSNDNRQTWPQACDAARSGCIADANTNSPPGDINYRRLCTVAWDACNFLGTRAPHPGSKIAELPDGSTVVFPPNSFDAQHYPKYRRR
ncbi:MAG: hypothetical protein K2P94_10345 [Rhodospirillaceae bacterium]|nr:hypothetical protein [Rhodospirillaceae bacterium]